MIAEVVSVGTELLMGQTVDTHAATMGRVLAECGLTCHHRQTLGDDLARLTAALSVALARADVVVTVGGLGPTEDDLTRDAIAAALKDEMVFEPSVEKQLREIFELRKLRWTDSQKRQAMRPASGRLISNPNGTAPGLICEKDGKVVIALPGPKGEFGPMVEGPVRSFLSQIAGSQVIHSRTLRICAMGESAVEEKIRPLMYKENPYVAPYAHPGEVHIRVSAKAGSMEEAEAMIAPVEAEIRSLLGDVVFGVDQTSLEAAVLELLSGREETVSTAESLTGGGLGERFTSVPGCSGAYVGGFVTYDSRVKEAVLGVSAETLASHGPVSAQTASEMASRCLEKMGSTYAVSLTGNAGPTSDEDGKPVGLVFVGVAGPGGVEVEEHMFRGLRDDVRRRSEQAALVLLRKVLLSVER